MRKRLVLGFVMILMVIGLSGNASAQFWSDWWWNPSESGWGVNIGHQYDTIVISLYLYGSDGAPHWYTGALNAGSFNSYGYRTYQGELIDTTGPWFGAVFNPGAVTRAVVGSATFSPLTTYRAELTYLINGVTMSKVIERFSFRHITLSGAYHGGMVVVYNSCTTDPAVGEYETISMAVNATVDADGVSGGIAINVYENGIFSCTLNGTYHQYGALFEALTDDCLTGSYLQLTDFFPSETGISGISAIAGPGGCVIGYSIGLVRVN